MISIQDTFFKHAPLETLDDIVNFDDHYQNDDCVRSREDCIAILSSMGYAELYDLVDMYNAHMRELWGNGA